MITRRNLLKTASLAPLAPQFASVAGPSTDLTRATVVVRPGTLPHAEKAAATVLVEEVARRCGVKLPVSTQWPSSGRAIAITSEPNVPGWHVPECAAGLEGYRLLVDKVGHVWIAGKDARGTLFGVGQLLRRLDFGHGSLRAPAELDVTTTPAYPIRGHQLGYRAQANSYDAWSPEQFDQYIRELTFFGVNSVEGIPLQDERPTVASLPRRDMNRAISRICERYGLDHWAWVPVDFDLKDTAKRAAFLDSCRQFFEDSAVLHGIFVPGGDPGDNPPDLVLPFLEDMAKRLLPAHRSARIWLSLQRFNKAETENIYTYFDQKAPEWFGGLVAGPSSRPIPEMRARLSKRYPVRDYPDITHNKLSQYEVPSWDQAYALTLGREAINPRPAEYALIHNKFARYTGGFISYSDGCHDDVNKTIWSALSWNPDAAVRDILIDYARVYFSPRVGEAAADGIFALERNWRGPLVHNGAVEGTLLEWQKLERESPELSSNWRWQMCLLRAYYDTYTRRRLIREQALEAEANRAMATAREFGPSRAMASATEILNRVVTQPTAPELRRAIEDLCGRLFQSIGLQTSVQKFKAIGPERGAVLDFVDYPLNNRWWLEDEFRKIEAVTSDRDKTARLLQLATWENPGPGSFYDDIGNIAKSPRVLVVPEDTAPEESRIPHPTYWWLNGGKSRARLSWQVTMWPAAVVYDGVDADARYVVRSTGIGQALLKINGQRIQPTLDGREMGQFKEFPVPPEMVRTRKLTLTWDRPTGEEHLNWRQHSRLAEVWLIRTHS